MIIQRTWYGYYSILTYRSTKQVSLSSVNQKGEEGEIERLVTIVRRRVDILHSLSLCRATTLGQSPFVLLDLRRKSGQHIEQST